jgi:hypothetical protein
MTRIGNPTRMRARIFAASLMRPVTRELVALCVEQDGQPRAPVT